MSNITLADGDKMYIKSDDEYVLDCSYEKMIKIVKEYIKCIGGFEKLAEWGLIRP